MALDYRRLRAVTAREIGAALLRAFGCASLAAILTLLTALPGVSQEQSKGPPSFNVQFLVTDCWGQPIRAARIEVVSANGTTVNLNYPQENHARISAAFRRLQPGHYQLMLFKGGQVKFSQEVDVRALDNEVTIK